MKYIVAVAFLMFTQTPATDTEYTPTEIQRLRLEVKQKDARFAGAQLQQAQQAYQTAMRTLVEESIKIKKENKWPNELTFDPETMTYNMPPKAPPKEEEKKPQ